MMKLYGVPGWGSAISEVMLTLADIPYQFVNVDGLMHPARSGPYSKRLIRYARCRRWCWSTGR
jgi:GST-like protein